MNPPGQPLLDIRNLSLSYNRRGTSIDKRMAVDRVSFSIQSGRILGLVGASGAGKSSIARAILRLIEADSGEILYRGNDIRVMNSSRLMELRGQVQIIFQDAGASLSPRRTIARTLLEPMQHFSIGDPASRQEKMCRVLETVGLDSEVLRRYPHQFSSGQQQRIAIARALVTDPGLLIADEAVAALDVSVQAQILQLIQKLQVDHGITCLFISHDLSVIRQIADEVAVMFEGRLVEHTPVDDFFTRPSHPYSASLLDAAVRFA